METVAAGVITGVVSTGINEYLRDGKKCLDELDLQKNYENLEREAKKLCARRNDVQAKINRDTTKHPKEECIVWIDWVKKLEKEVEMLKARYNAEKANSWLPLALNKKLKETFDEVHQCWADGHNFATGEVMIEKPPEPVIKITSAPRIDDKKSLQDVVEEVLVNLRCEDVKRIGLWGMVGVGKTAIMQNLNNNGQVANMFHIVIFVTVTGEGDDEKMVCSKTKLQRATENLQIEIAQRLKMNNADFGNTKKLSSEISKALKGKKCLLLLDDVWGKFNLEDIGINGMEEDSKIVLATRDRYILDDMDVDHDIKVNPLSEAEARTLFMEKLGPKIDRSFVREAQLVLRECGRLPLVIDRVAKAFRKYKEIRLWRAGLEKLRKWPDVDMQGMDEVLSRLRFCYDKLDDEDVKICFLYAAIFTHGCQIYRNYLLECWIAEGFVREVENFTARAQEILHNLISASLLEDGEYLKHVKMNKVLRNLALKISTESKDSKILVKAGEKLQEAPSKENWEGPKWISLMDNDLCRLPENPDCSNLSTLLLQRNDNLKNIPESFFQSMENLKVLDLHGTKIGTLPTSLFSRSSLRALYFNACKKLMELSCGIQALKHLEVLDIRGTGIDIFSLPLGNLSRLRCLRMSLTNFNGEPMNVDTPHHGISKLKLLEELVIDVHPENQSWFAAAKVLAEEVAKLTTLTSLSFCLPDNETLQHFITNSHSWKEMDSCFSFKFFAGVDQPARYIGFDCAYDICRCLKYVNGVGSHSAIQEVLAEANVFELIGHRGASSVSDFGIDNLNNIKNCRIENCNEIKTIIKGSMVRTTVFEWLEELSINKCYRLESICEGSLVPSGNGSLCQLTVLNFSNCKKLKKIFSRGMIRQLSKLRELKVIKCEEVEEIVAESGNNGTEPDELAALTTLILQDLPKLRIVWNTTTLISPPLKEFKISGCPSGVDLTAIFP